VICAKRTPDAVEVEAGKTYYWCTCGRSKNQVCARLCLRAALCFGIPFHSQSPKRWGVNDWCCCCIVLTLRSRCPSRARPRHPRPCPVSREQPFCDGSHKGTEFTPMPWTAEESGSK